MNDDINHETYREWVDEKVNLYVERIKIEITKMAPKVSKKMANQFEKMFNKRVKLFDQLHTELMYFSMFIYENSNKETRDEIFKRWIPYNFERFRSDYRDYVDEDENIS